MACVCGILTRVFLLLKYKMQAGQGGDEAIGSIRTISQGQEGVLGPDLCFRKIPLVPYERLTLKGEPEGRESSQEAV